MGLPIVIAHHLIWTVYGWWLPNDPRGSWSHIIRNDVLAELGEIHFGRKRLQPTSVEIRDFYREAGKRLKHEPSRLRTSNSRWSHRRLPKSLLR